MAKSILDAMLADSKNTRRTELAARRLVADYKFEAVTQYINNRQAGQYNEIVTEQLAKLDYCCPVCAKDLKERAATIDHIEPKSKYFHKATDESNFLVMCYPCNQNKSDRQFKEWRAKQIPASRNSIDYAIRLIHGQAKLESLIGQTA